MFSLLDNSLLIKELKILYNDSKQFIYLTHKLINLYFIAKVYIISNSTSNYNSIITTILVDTNIILLAVCLSLKAINARFEIF